MGGKPSLLSVGDFVVIQRIKGPKKDRETVKGKVREVLDVGAIINPTDDWGNRMLVRPVAFHDGDCMVMEVNGDPLF